LVGVAVWNHLSGDEQQLSTIDMNSAFAQPMKVGQTMQQPFARPAMPSSWHPASVSQPMSPTRSQPFLQQVRAEAAKPKAKAKPKPTAPPFSESAWLAELQGQLKNPEKIMIKFGGGTGGLLSKAFTEEMYIMTWKNPKGEAIFEMPTGGAAKMNAGDNMIYLARKEHGIALGTMLRSKFKVKDYRIFRSTPSGEIQLLHPADGVYPEKANPGRVGKNQIPGMIGSADAWSDLNQLEPGELGGRFGSPLMVPGNKNG